MEATEETAILKQARRIRYEREAARKKERQAAERAERQAQLDAERAARQAILTQLETVGRVSVEGHFVVVPGLDRWFEPDAAYAEIYYTLHEFGGRPFKVTFELVKE